MRAIKWAILFLFCAAAVGLLAFGPRPNRTLPQDAIVVDYWEKWTGNEEQAMRSLVNRFNETEGVQKHIYVRYVSTAAINQKTLVATAAGVPPDIAGLYDNNLVQFAAMDALEPLEEMAREHGITEGYYKPVFWRACNYDGHLYGLVSTPVVVALHYSKDAFADSAERLRDAGLDAHRPPGTLQELDRYAEALTTRDSSGRIVRAGFLPMEPNWFINEICFWFGGNFFDEQTHRFTLTDSKVVDAYRWVEGYSRRLGKDAMTSFQSGFGNFDSPQNAFFSGAVAMEEQGPLLANFIYINNPHMSTLLWPKDEEIKMPLAERVKNYSWSVAPFPSAVPGLVDVTYCSFDALTIPRGAKHKREAFEFIAWVNRQENMEALCKLHCKSSPLQLVSQDFLLHHPNPYIELFERLSRSPNAHRLPQVPIMPEVMSELTNLSQQVSLLQVDPQQALSDLQVRLQSKYDEFVRQQKARGSSAF